MTLSSVEPRSLEVDTTTPVRVTATVVGGDLIPGSVHLEQVSPDGRARSLGALNDRGLNGDLTAGDGVFSIVRNLRERDPGKVHLRVAASFRGFGRVRSPAVALSAGTLFAPGVGGSVQGPNGTTSRWNRTRSAMR